MDRFFYYLLGALAAVLAGVVGSIYFSQQAELTRKTAEAAASPTPSPTATPAQPDVGSLFGAPAAGLPTAAMPIPTATPARYTPLNPGKTVTVRYPGFNVVYSEALGNPLAVQYAMVGGAPPKRYGTPEKVRTPSPRLIDDAGLSRGQMALESSISLYFGKAAGRNTLLMTNLSPMSTACFAGPWREFSELEKRWAGEFQWIEIVAGPIFTNPPEQIGGIVVPAAFYRVYRRSYGDCLAFIIPQEASKADLRPYLTTIAEVENATGMAFFANTITAEARSEKAAELW
jgi:DNA/RNA endonuclease G (NUC1)